jgi:hypothetical protein
MAPRADYEEKTQQKFTIIVNKSALDLVTPEVGRPCLIGGNLSGVIVSIDPRGDDKVVVDVGRSIYKLLITAASPIDEGADVFYKIGATVPPFLADTGTFVVGKAVRGKDTDIFPTVAAEIEMAVLFNA